jgi:hypothetical protein
MIRTVAMALAAFALGPGGLGPGALAQEAPAPRGQTMAQALSEILKDVRDDKNLRTDRRPALAEGANAADAIRNQLLARGCWGDYDDIPDARRLRATLAVRFGPDGHFLEPPKLIEPKDMPENDPPLQLFILRAKAALEKCDVKGFVLPAGALEMQPPLIVELVFLP